MTAREELAELFESLSEEEAEACVRTIQGGRSSNKKWADPRERDWPLKPKLSREDAADFFRSWAAAGPTLTDKEWDDFASSLDASRPHRPLFN